MDNTFSTTTTPSFTDSQEFEMTSEKITDGNDQITELSKKGYQLLKENDTEGARHAFESILSLEDNNNYALVGLGDIARKQNNFNEAISFYNKCLSFYPSNNYALFGLADCYKALNQFSKAIDIWQQYLIHDDKNITVISGHEARYAYIKLAKKIAISNS